MRKAQNTVRLSVVAPATLRQAVAETASLRLMSSNTYIRAAVQEALRRDQQRLRREEHQGETV